MSCQIINRYHYETETDTFSQGAAQRTSADDLPLSDSGCAVGAVDGVPFVPCLWRKNGE